MSPSEKGTVTVIEVGCVLIDNKGAITVINTVTFVLQRRAGLRLGSIDSEGRV